MSRQNLATIKKLIEANNGAISSDDNISPKAPYTQDNLEKIAKECSVKERDAEKAEREEYEMSLPYWERKTF